MSPKKPYSFMIEPELAEALKDAKARKFKSEGQIIRDALIEWFERNGVTLQKTDRKRASTRKRS